MKKYFYLSLIITCLIQTTKAQIPNFSFENWTSMGSYENPDGWGTLNNMSNSLGVYTATKASPGSSGANYLKLTSKSSSMGILNGIAVSGILDSITMQPKSGFAYSARPSSFKGKWQHMIYGSSQGSISVTLSKWNATSNTRETIATANQTLSGMVMSWASFNILFTYLSGDNPDSCIIVFKASGASPTNDDYLWLDNLTFAGTVTGVYDELNETKKFSIYPNPVKDELKIIPLSDAFQSLEIYNVIGKLVMTKSSSLNSNIDVSELKKGLYFIKLINSQSSLSQKFIKE